MSKVVQAVNRMVSNPARITNVTKGQNEYYFVYDGKYTWSVAERDEHFHLWYYAGKPDVHELLEHESVGSWDDVQMVHYDSHEIGTKEAKASFAELLQIVKERLYGVDAVLDDIIAGGEA